MNKQIKTTKKTKTMNKDDYAKMKMRQDIAKAFIDKLDTVNVEDIGLIPAIEDYIMTGDKDFF